MKSLECVRSAEFLEITSFGRQKLLSIWESKLALIVIFNKHWLLNSILWYHLLHSHQRHLEVKINQIPGFLLSKQSQWLPCKYRAGVGTVCAPPQPCPCVRSQPCPCVAKTHGDPRDRQTGAQSGEGLWRARGGRQGAGASTRG